MFVPFNSIDMSISRLTGILYFITLIPEIKLFLKLDRIEIIMFAAWLFFGLLTLISLLNINEVSTDFFNLSLFQNILLLWALVNHARKDYLILEKAMLFFAFSAVTLAIFFLVGIGVKYQTGRLGMFNENQNTLGFRMNLGIIILLLSVIQNKLQLGKIRYLLLTPIPLMVNFLFETGSRLAFISFLFSIIAGIALFKTKKSSDKIIATAIGITSLIILGVFLMQSDVLKNRLFESIQTGDSSGRDEIWSKIIPLIKEKPVFGVGDTGYSLYTQMVFGKPRSPHNVILEVICLTGFAGLLIYFSFLFNVFLKSYQTYRKNGLLLPILLIIPILGALFTGQILTRKVGWIIFAYMIGSTAIKSVSMNKSTQ